MSLPIDSWIPAQQISFNEIPRKGTASRGDWIIEKGERSWKLYTPQKQNEDRYNIYHLGFSGDDKSVFSINSPAHHLIVKPNSKSETDVKIMEKVVNDLRQMDRPEKNPFRL